MINLDYVYKDGDIKVSNSAGYVLTVNGIGKTPKVAGENVEKLLNKIVLPKSFWRSDWTSHYDKSKKDLIKWGYLPPEPKEVEDTVDLEDLVKKIQEITSRKVNDKVKITEEQKKKDLEEMTKSIKDEYDKKILNDKREMAEELKKIKESVRSIIYED
jgi:hypothetical protein